MDTTSEPEHTEEFAEKPNNIITIWKRLWPLIISTILFVLMGIAWNEPVVYKDNGCPIPNENYIGSAASGMIAALIISRLLPSPGARRSLAAWFRYIIRTALVVIGAIGATIANATLFTMFTIPDGRIIGVVIGYIGPAIVILIGHERKRPTRYQAFIWLTSLLLLIIIWYLADTLFWQSICGIYDSGPVLPYARVFSPKLTLV